jgi:hypothetical protein
MSRETILTPPAGVLRGIRRGEPRQGEVFGGQT